MPSFQKSVIVVKDVTNNKILEKKEISGANLNNGVDASAVAQNLWDASYDKKVSPEIACYIENYANDSISDVVPVAKNF